MSKQDRKECLEVLFFFLYIASMFLTNAYVQVYRYDDWSTPSNGIELSRREAECRTFKTIGATIFPPVYWVSRASIYAVKNVPYMRVEFGDKE